MEFYSYVRVRLLVLHRRRWLVGYVRPYHEAVRQEIGAYGLAHLPQQRPVTCAVGRRGEAVLVDGSGQLERP